MHPVPNGSGIDRGGANSMILLPEVVCRGGVYKMRLGTPIISIITRRRNFESNVL